MGGRYLPERASQFLLLFQLIWLIMFQIPHSHGYRQRQYHPLCFLGDWFWAMCVCVCICVCLGLEKIFIYLSLLVKKQVVSDLLESHLTCCGVSVTSAWRRKCYLQHLQGHFKTSQCKIF